MELFFTWLNALFFNVLPRIGLSLLSFIISLPTYIYTILSYTVTFTFDFSFIFGVTLVVSILILIFIRYRFLTKYSRLPFIQRRPGPPIDLQPTEDGTDLEQEGSSYPNEFLSAFLSSIKVFGYLEGPVFHELARNLQTKTLQENELLFDCNDIPTSFYIVVDGCMQVFISQKTEPAIEHEVLLNEVKSGGTVTSLFSILSLLGKDNQGSYSSSTPPEKKNEQQVIFPNLQDDAQINASKQLDLNISPIASPTFKMGGETGIRLHLNLVARAKTTTTLAVIPAEVFKKLNQKFPIDTAHIVQVILARFQRVTFLTLHRYLGLTSELTEIEKKVNESAGDGLPLDFYPCRRSQSGLKKNLAAKGDEDVSSPMGSPNPECNETGHEACSEEQEQLILKEKVFNCIASQIGLVDEADYMFDELPRTIRKSPSHFSSTDIHMNEDNFDTMSLSSVTSVTSIASSILSTMGYESQISIERYERGSFLVNAGQCNPGIYFVIDGLLEVSVPESEIKGKSKEKDLDQDESEMQKLFTIQPGGMSGYLASVTGHPSFVNVKAAVDTVVGFLSKSVLDRIIEKHPSVLFTLARRLTCHLSPLILQIDFALEWMQTNGGQILCRQESQSDSIFIVINGRLRATYCKRNRNSLVSEVEHLEEFGQGDSVGELEVLTDTARPYTLHAIRDTELIKLPSTLFNALALKDPRVTIRISRIIAERSSQKFSKVSAFGNIPRSFPESDITASVMQNSLRYSATQQPPISNFNLRSVAILPMNSLVPVTEFAYNLRDALENHVHASTTLLNQDRVFSVLGKHAFTKMGKLKLSNWLWEQEENSRIVLYLADGGVGSAWTQRCIKQADCILLIALGETDPSSIGSYERLLISLKSTARKELVLLHRERHCVAGSTQLWLKNRLWIHAHHHIHMPLKSSQRFIGNQNEGKSSLLPSLPSLRNPFHKYRFLRSIVESPLSMHTGNRSDFARLARRLCGKSIGLVLGGGGARGISHLGVIRALEDAGIPIDMIGGTSIGAFMGALYARDSDTVALLKPAKSFSGRMASVWRKIFDLTYPVTSWFTGHEFNRGIWKVFSDMQIEDLWINYFCVTTNITHSKMEIHQVGYIWRYVRASMSLSGFLPPLCDNGTLLVDGGYVNNLPSDVMKSLGCDVVIAVDVASVDDTSPVMYGDSLSGWTVIFSRWNPFYKFARIPSLADIQQRLAYISSVGQLEAAKLDEDVFYMRVPVTQYGTLDFGKFNEIEQVGYKYGKELIQQWKAASLLSRLNGVCKNDGKQFPKVKLRHKQSSGSFRWKSKLVNVTSRNESFSGRNRYYPTWKDGKVVSSTPLPSPRAIVPPPTVPADPPLCPHSTPPPLPTAIRHELKDNEASEVSDPFDSAYNTIVAETERQDIVDSTAEFKREDAKGDLDDWLASLETIPRKRRVSI